MDAGCEGFAFDGDFAEEAEAVGVGGQAVPGEVADDDVGGVFGTPGERLEAGGEVHAVADDGVVEAAVGADVAGDDGGGVDADAEGERGAAFGGKLAVEGGEGFAHAEGGAHGAVGAVGDVHGGAEEGHDFVADVFVDDATLAFDFGAHAVEVAVEEGEEFGRGEGFAEGSEAAQIDEEDDEHALRFMTAMHKQGMSAPEDFRIVGYNDTEASAFSDPPLSTIRQNFDYVGHWLIKSALGLARGAPDQSSRLPRPQMLVRATCGGQGKVDAAFRAGLPNLDIIIPSDDAAELAVMPPV